MGEGGRAPAVSRPLCPIQRRGAERGKRGREASAADRRLGRRASRKEHMIAHISAAFGTGASSCRYARHAGRHEPALPVIALPASIADTARSLADGAATFFDNLAQVDPGYLALALAVFFLYLLARSRATFNALRAAYPLESFPWSKIWAPTSPPTGSTASSPPAAAASCNSS